MKEIPYQPTPPEVTVIQPSNDSVPQTPSLGHESNKLRDETQGESKAATDDKSNSPRKAKKPLEVAIDIREEDSEKVDNAPTGGNEGVKKKKKKKKPVPTEGEQGEDTEKTAPKKKKKRKPKTSERESELPPLVLMGRTLPTLPSSNLPRVDSPV